MRSAVVTAYMRSMGVSKHGHAQLSFPWMIHWICWICWLKIFAIMVNIFDTATSCDRDQDATTAPARHVRDKSFKLIPVHASVIYQIPWIHWIHRISVPFRKNSSHPSFHLDFKVGTNKSQIQSSGSFSCWACRGKSLTVHECLQKIVLQPYSEATPLFSMKTV